MEEQITKKEKVTKNPKKVEAGRKGAEARKAKHEEVLEKLRKVKDTELSKQSFDEPSKQSFDEPRPSCPEHKIPNYTYIAAAVVAVSLGGVAYYCYRPRSSQSDHFEPSSKLAEPTELRYASASTKPDPFSME